MFAIKRLRLTDANEAQGQHGSHKKNPRHSNHGEGFLLSGRKNRLGDLFTAVQHVIYRCFDFIIRTSCTHAFWWHGVETVKRMGVKRVFTFSHPRCPISCGTELGCTHHASAVTSCTKTAVYIFARFRTRCSRRCGSCSTFVALHTNTTHGRDTRLNFIVIGDRVTGKQTGDEQDSK